MAYTYIDPLYSDLHKQAYGVRPHPVVIACWVDMTPDEKQVHWDKLSEIAGQAGRSINDQQMASIIRFEALVAAVMIAGASDRVNAIEWLMCGLNVSGDWDYFCYLEGLPPDYFSKTAINTPRRSDHD